MHISKDVNLDKGFAYDASLNKDNQDKIEELWSSNDNEQFAIEEKNRDPEMIFERKKLFITIIKLR